MFRRLLTAFALLTLAALGGAAVTAALLIPDAGTRGWVLVGLACMLPAALALAALLSASLAWQFTQPLKELIAAVEKMAEGTGQARVYPPENDEAGLLGQTFNRMSDHLGKRITALEEDRQQLRTILTSMVEGVVALDAGQRILFANERASELLEFTGPPPVGRRLYEVVRNRRLLDAVQAALSGPNPHREEVAWGGVTPRSLTVHAARIPGDPPPGAVLVLHDTTELRRLERLRQEFVANVSHELKTPLSVIKACVETLIDGAIDDMEHRGRFLERIAWQSERLHALILDLLSLARIESGAELLEFQEVPLWLAAKDCLGRHQPRAEAKGQSLLLEPGGEDVKAWADEEAVADILENLLDNAVKYTPDGGEVRVRVWAEGGQGRLEVRDNGIGIPAADLPRIFERFYRVDKARSRELGGTGLGLAIVKHLVQAMHGSIAADSRAGAGTAFVVSLPTPEANPTPPSHDLHNS